MKRLLPVSDDDELVGFYYDSAGGAHGFAARTQPR